MPDGFSIDDSELRQLAADLGEVPKRVGPFLNSAIQKSAGDVKKDWREQASGIRYAKGFPPSIDYTVTASPGLGVSTIQAEIGPDKGKAQGALGNLIEYGGAVHGGLSSARDAGASALRRVEADFERGLDRALQDGERAAGL